MNEIEFQAREVMDAALELPVASRQEFVTRACAGNEPLRSRVEELLKQADAADQFFAEARPDAAASPVALPSERPGDRIGRYKLLQRIGEGGCGVVYMAEQEVPVRRRVALKIIRLGMDTHSVIARFEAERQALALMDHPNIARVLDAGATETGRPYFVMELVRGLKITEYCDQNLLATPDRLRLFAQVCLAVQHAHQKGVIHRDIKPSNILVTSHDDGAPLPKVIDFGIAKATTDQPLTDKTLFTQFEMFLGTPAYMSPEQAEFSAQDVDTRTDIYSLGVLLYELLTGQPPFDSETLLKSGLDALRKTIRETDPPRPSTRLRTLTAVDLTELARRRRSEPPRLVSLIRGDLDWIVVKALEKDRTRRYPTANALALEVQRYLANEPVTARPPSRLYTLRKLAERHRMAASTLASIVTLLVAGITITTHQWHRARGAERIQRELREQAEQARERAEQENYFSTIGIAEKFIEEGQTERALELLLNCPPRHRHWEWGRLILQCRSEMRTFDTGQRGILQLSFSRDSRLLATRDSTGQVKLWDLARGALVRMFTGLASDAPDLHWSYHTNQLWFVTSNGAVRAWNADTGHECFVLPETDVRWIALHPHAPRVLTAGPTLRAAVWDGNTGDKLFELEGTTPGSVGECFFSPDGTRIMAINQNFTHRASTEVARVWDPRNGRELHRLHAPAEPWVGRWLWLSRDARCMASIHADGTLRWWDAETGQHRFTKLGQGVRPRYAMISPDAHTVGAYCDNGTIRLWNIGTGEEVNSPTERAFHIQFTGDGEHYVTSGGDRVARVWAVSGGEPFVLRGHGAFVGASDFSPDGRLVASAAEDGVVRVWSLRPGRESLPATDWVQDACFDPQGGRLVTAHFDLHARVWDMETGQEMVRLLGHRGVVNSAVFTPDGRRVVTGSFDRTAKLWDAVTGHELRTFIGHTRGVQRVAVSPDSRRIATASWDGSAKLWDIDTGGELLTLRGHTEALRDVAFSPDGRRVATASVDLTARVWDAERGTPELVLPGHSELVSAVAFSPDGAWVVTGCSDRRLRFWDPRTGELRRTLTGRTRIYQLAFSPDGRRLFTASTEASTALGHPSVEVWDVAAGRELMSLPGREGVWHSVAFSAKGRRLASGGTDGQIRVREAFPWAAPASPEPGARIASLLAPPQSAVEDYWQIRLAAERQARPSAEGLHTPQTLSRALWAARAPVTPERCLDLTAQYNGWLDVAWLPPRLQGRLDDDLANLPRGLVTFGNVLFDVRGVVQLDGTGNERRSWFSPKAGPIEVGRTCRRLYFLHATVGAVASGTVLGEYVFEYREGPPHQHPLIYGRDLLDWWASPGEPAPSEASVAWTGKNLLASRDDHDVRLYLRPVDNPHPERLLARIRFRASPAESRPFLVAVTAE